MNPSVPSEHAGHTGVARALTWRYAIALALVATLSTAAWISLDLVITEQKSTAAVVNVSGRQRMLSQRTALFSNLLTDARKNERPAFRAKLQEAIALMDVSHQGLTHGNAEMGLPGILSPTVRAMYFNGPHALDTQVETYIKAVRELLQLDDGALQHDHPLLQYITRTASGPLVAALDDMVQQYQLEGETAVARLKQAETLFWGSTLLLLLLEAVLIFHPFTRHVRTIIGKLQQVTDELRLHQEHLEELVRLAHAGTGTAKQGTGRERGEVPPDRHLRQGRHRHRRPGRVDHVLESGRRADFRPCRRRRNGTEPAWAADTGK